MPSKTDDTASTTGQVKHDLRKDSKTDETASATKQGSQDTRKYSKSDDTESMAKETREGIRKDSKGLTTEEATDCTQHWEDPEHLAQNQKEYKKFQEDSRARSNTSDDDDEQADGSRIKKRGRGANAHGHASTTASNKKQKTSSSSGPHDDDDDDDDDDDEYPAGRAGDITRVPTDDQKVQWKGPPGSRSIDGSAVEVVYEEKRVGGKQIRASKEDPRVVVQCEATGKTSVHRPEAVYF
ncbi:uncharacterized protein K460DRAFT_367685, partial [Cucurbitaria berberidis CBS 394.84]